LGAHSAALNFELEARYVAFKLWQKYARGNQEWIKNSSPATYRRHHSNRTTYSDIFCRFAWKKGGKSRVDQEITN
jgi:hypothetical protein